VASRGLIDPGDRCLYRITDSVEEATAELLGFYRNFQSLRFVGDRLVIRLRQAPSEGQAARLSGDFADIVTRGALEVLDRPLPAERRPEDSPELPRVALRFDRLSYARLRQLIDALNALP
jgi:hypothetical protein